MLTVAIALAAEIKFDFDSAFKLANIVKYRDIDATVSTVAMFYRRVKPPSDECLRALLL